LRERYSEYKTALLVLLGEEGASSTALTLCMRLLKTEGEHFRNGQEFNFPAGFLTEILQVLLKPESNENVRKEFSEQFVEEYDDIRFYTFEAIELVFQNYAFDQLLTLPQKNIRWLTVIRSGRF
jgi:U3 small nucleolar RNA-associated protein 19